MRNILIGREGDHLFEISFWRGVCKRRVILTEPGVWTRLVQSFSHGTRVRVILTEPGYFYGAKLGVWFRRVVLGV